MVVVVAAAAVAIVLNSYRLLHIFCGSLSACHTQKKTSICVARSLCPKSFDLAFAIFCSPALGIEQFDILLCANLCLAIFSVILKRQFMFINCNILFASYLCRIKSANANGKCKSSF